MNFSTRVQDDVAIVDIEGNLDTTTAPTARGGFDSLLDEAQKTILVNLAKLDYTSSAGLRVLLALAKELQMVGGKLHLCSLNDTVRDIFEMSGFDGILKVFPSEAEALAAFRCTASVGSENSGGHR